MAPKSTLSAIDLAPLNRFWSGNSAVFQSWLSWVLDKINTPYWVHISFNLTLSIKRTLSSRSFTPPLLWDISESIPSDSYATAAKLESYKDASIEHIFVYYFDKTINPDDITDFSEIQTKVTSLYNLIKEYNKKDSKESSVAFFLVDTSTVAGAAALNNTNLGNISSTNQLAYMYEGVYSSYAYGVKDGEDVLSGSTITEIKSAILFVSNLK